jgi:hypothetical protein
MSDATWPQAAFRLDLEQQKKRAKELLRAAKAADSTALARMAAACVGRSAARQKREPKLADAQLVIARELGFAAWAGLKSHIASLDHALAAIQREAPPDADLRTLHVRCGSDIQQTLRDAGFCGHFLEVSYPYCHGPVSTASNHLELEARFISELTEPLLQVSFEGALRRRLREEQDLAASTAEVERIVLWMEHDCFDQLVLLRCLDHYSSLPDCPRLELIDVRHFPGSVRFIGLGQLPAEALRLLWKQRQQVSPQQLALARQAFADLQRSDPRPLAALMRSGAAALPHLAGALHRQLQELPWIEDGLSLTERLILQILDESSITLYQLLGQLNFKRDPLPFSTDLSLLRTVRALAGLSEPVLTLSAGNGHWADQRVELTATGRAVLRAERDLLSLQPPARWVGGVQVTPKVSWRWDERRRDALAS